MAKEIARRSRDVPVPRTGDVDPDGYAGMPIVITEDPEWLSFMAPETAPFGTFIQRWYRYLIIPVRGSGYLMRRTGDAILRVTMYWYATLGIIISVTTLIIIWVTR